MPNQKSGPQKNHSSKKSGKGEDTAWINSDRVVNKAQRIIGSAVNILEEEIAAGILAAKRIEKKLIDVNEIRSDPDALMNRIRRDSHELLDLFIDVFASVTTQMNKVVEALKKETDKQGDREKDGIKTKSQTAEILVLEPDHPLKPGETISLTMTLKDDGSGGSAQILLRKSDLIGPGNQIISLRAMTINPSRLSIKGNEEKDVTITVKVPDNAKAGRYNAFLSDSNNPQLCVLVAIEVTK
jgi:hypothetical protein